MENWVCLNRFNPALAVCSTSFAGAALSMRSVTGAPIKFMGAGEKLDALEAFHPSRVADRILDMGDVVSLVEKASETLDKAEAEKLAAKMKKGQFDMNDLASQLNQMKKLGGMKGVLGMLPGVGKLQENFEVHLFDFAGDLYGRTLRVQLLDFIRPEMKFAGLDQLKAQIAADGQAARAILA